MRFFCGPNKLDNWFTAAVLDDTDYLNKYMKQYATRKDTRATSNELKNIYGTTAIHLAAIFQKQHALNLLLPYEIKTVTDAQITLKTSHLPNANGFQMAPGVDCLHLAIARNNPVQIDQILTYLAQNPQQTIQSNIDDDNTSHLMLVCYFPETEATLKLVENTLLLSEFSICVKGKGAIQICSQLGRWQMLQKLVNLVAVFPNLEEFLWMQLVAVHNKTTIFDYLESIVDFEKSCTTLENKKICKRMVNQLLGFGVKKMQKNLQKYGLMLGEFFKVYSGEIVDQTEEINFAKFGQQSELFFEDKQVENNQQVGQEVSQEDLTVEIKESIAEEEKLIE